MYQEVIKGVIETLTAYLENELQSFESIVLHNNSLLLSTPPWWKFKTFYN